MRTLIIAVSMFGVGVLSGMYVTMEGLNPGNLFIVAAVYAARSYEIGCIKHEMFDTSKCIVEARDQFVKHTNIFAR